MCGTKQLLVRHFAGVKIEFGPTDSRQEGRNDGCQLRYRSRHLGTSIVTSYPWLAMLLWSSSHPAPSHVWQNAAHCGC